MYKINDKEHLVFAEIIGYNNRNGYAPTRQYLIDKFSLSPKTLSKFLKRFELEGKIKRDRYKTRGIIIL